MTREEADFIGSMNMCDEISNEAYKKIMCHCEEQEPCEDAISRKAVLDKLNRLIEVERLQGTDEMGYGRERVSAYECMIHAVESEYLYPTIQPQPKTGHWIFDEILDKHYYCSECKSMGVDYWDYCPNCGAKMEESEDKE